MREMKDSGIAWNGLIPATWETRRGKYVLSLLSRPVREDDEVITCFRDGQVTLRKNRREEGFTLSDKEIGYQGIESGDLVIHGMDGFAGSIGISDSRGKATPVLNVCDSEEDKRYLMYYLRSMAYNDVFTALATGIRVRSCDLRWKKLSELPYLLPSSQEQAQIVSTIENKSKKVDALIANEQKQIEKLKQYKQSLITEVVTKGLDPSAPMKDSGVEWIGSIPFNWEIIRFRFLANVTTGNQDTQDAVDDGEYPFYVRSPKVEHSNEYTFEGEGILMAGDGAGAGRVFHHVNGKYAVHQRVYRFYNFNRILPRLLLFYLENLFSTVMDYGSAKTTVPSVRLPMIQDFNVCVPPVSEQKIMIERIEEITNRTNTLISIKQSKIDKLNAYKKSLIAEIKSYFTDEQVIRSVCALTGFDYDRLVGKSDFRLVIEPIAYFTYRGSQYAMTATEAALYDRAVNGDLRAHLCSLSHKNLPLAIFLEMADLGYPAWAGSTSTAASDADIIAALGIGIVHFSELTQEPEIGVYDYEYRVNTEVVTAVTVSGGQSVPDRPVSVEFVIAGRTFTVSNVYYPEGDSQLAWVRWTTPAAPCAMTITVRARGGGTVSDAQIRVNVVDLSGSDPPNPTANDRNNGFTLSPLPVNPETASLTWGVWSPWWHAYWVWISTGEGSGYWVDCGWWEFDYNGYAASLTAAMSLTPDTKCPTAGGDTMKSGYGTNERVAARVSTTQSAAVTEAQTAVSYFPEFGYTGFWRLLRQTRGGYRAEFAFAPNHYSTYNSPAHFTPVWYRDGEYRVYTRLMDAWTPAGMLQLNLSDAVTISGDLWDDWHIAPAN